MFYLMFIHNFSTHTLTKCSPHSSFKYLGALITSLNDIETEIKSKIAVGNKCYYALRTILKRRSISQSIKIRLYKTIRRPVVTYGAETWTVTSKRGKNVNDMGKKDIEENI